MKRLKLIVSTAILGGLLIGCTEEVKKDPHVELDNALKAFEYASKMERNVAKRNYDGAIEELDNIAKIYKSGMFSFGSGKFSSKEHDEKALIAMEELFSAVRVLRSQVRQMKTKRVTKEQKAQYQVNVEQLLNTLPKIALAHYDKKSAFYVAPPRAKLQAMRNKLRALSYRSPDQTKFAAGQMIASINKLLRG
ncbi:MAG: hypothetical protein AAGA18_04440 [Verrucomicrobiota bacterium]